MSTASRPTRTFGPGQHLFVEGHTGSEAYLIKEGLVTIWKMQGAKRVNLATRGEGEIIGEMALIDETTRSATVTAQQKVTAEIITKQDLDAWLAAAPGQLRTIVLHLFESLRTANSLVGMYAAMAPPGKRS
ncbi:MAG: cyclic nucleotide-binding domain-containing protein [Kiritimatiellae bacterium]|nr:cyclic nucleotide-binding domain-containing protein [Kiritimatiellia bacterium]